MFLAFTKPVLYFRKNYGSLAAFVYKLILLFNSVLRLIFSPLVFLSRSESRERKIKLITYYRRLILSLNKMNFTSRQFIHEISMRILFNSQIIPWPPDAGPKVKTWNVLRYLKESGHQVVLVAFARKEEEASYRLSKEVCEEVHTISFEKIEVTGHLLLAA